MIQIGDRVKVDSRIGAKLASGTVVAVLPGVGDRVTMYRVRFDDSSESWVDEGIVYGPFIDQNTGWDN